MQEARASTGLRLGAMAHELIASLEEREQLLSRLSSFGLATIQLGTPLLEEILTDKERIVAWSAQLQAAGRPIIALGGYRNLVAPNETQRRANIAFLQNCLELAPLFGTAIVATETGTRSREDDWGPSPENQGTEAWDILCATLRELLPVAERHGTILAVEGHVNHVINTPERLERLLEQFPTPHLQVVLDPYNYLGRDQLSCKEQVAAAFLQQFRNRFVLAHLKDISQQGAESGTPAFGQGIFPQQLYLDFVRKERPDLPLILEHVSVDQLPGILEKVLVTWDLV
ncbi:MAG: sugar phosphate isomerase/epimerase [Ktedonobacteraceae bacterium]|nr:sugar phosphate isomerase/epimerase [Ktedonobacteraceae bacterium]